MRKLWTKTSKIQGRIDLWFFSYNWKFTKEDHWYLSYSLSLTEAKVTKVIIEERRCSKLKFTEISYIVSYFIHIFCTFALTLRPSLFLRAFILKREQSHVYEVMVDLALAIPVEHEHEGNNPLARDPQHSARETVKEFRCHQAARHGNSSDIVNSQRVFEFHAQRGSTSRVGKPRVMGTP